MFFENKLGREKLSFNKQESLLAFTLAEVLIVLAIIGVVALIVLPGVILNTQDQEYKTAFKENFNAFSQAAKLIIANNGGTALNYCGPYDSWPDDDCAALTFGKYMNVIKTCGFGGAFTGTVPVSGNCWHKDDVAHDKQGGVLNNASEGLLLANGTFVTMRQRDTANCTDTSYGNVEACTWIYMDVNGAKGPNIVGKDIFSIYFNQNGISQIYSIVGQSYPDINAVQNSCKQSGYGCETLILLGVDF